MADNEGKDQDKSVINLSQEKDRRRKRKESEAVAKLKPGELEKLLAKVIDGGDNFCMVTPMEKKYYTYTESDGSIQIVQVVDQENKIVSAVRTETICAELLKHCHDVIGSPLYAISDAQCERAVSFWKKYSEPLGYVPSAFAQKSSNGFAFSRMDFDIDDSETHWKKEIVDIIEAETINSSKYLVWKEFYSDAVWINFFLKCSDWKALAAFIGSIFYPESYRQQYLYLYGEGQDGKGIILSVIHRILGAAYWTESVGNLLGNRFATFGLIGKRVVELDDTNEASFMRSGAFKRLTGGSPIGAERKGKDQFSFVPECKFIITSNKPAEISSQRSDQRRIVYIEMGKQDINEGKEKEFEERMKGNERYLIEFCCYIYRQMCPSHGSIPVNKDCLMELARTAEEAEEDLFNEYFELVSSPPGALERLRAHVKESEMSEILIRRKGLKNSRQRGEFYRWLKNRHGISKKNVRLEDGSYERRFIGMKFRSF